MFYIRIKITTVILCFMVLSITGFSQDDAQAKPIKKSNTAPVNNTSNQKRQPLLFGLHGLPNRLPSRAGLVLRKRGPA